MKKYLVIPTLIFVKQTLPECREEKQLMDFNPKNHQLFFSTLPLIEDYAL